MAEKKYDGRFEVPMGTKVDLSDMMSDVARERIKVGMVMKMEVTYKRKKRLHSMKVVANSPQAGFWVEMIEHLKTEEEAEAEAMKLGMAEGKRQRDEEDARKLAAAELKRSRKAALKSKKPKQKGA